MEEEEEATDAIAIVLLSFSSFIFFQLRRVLFLLWSFLFPSVFSDNCTDGSKLKNTGTVHHALGDDEKVNRTTQRIQLETVDVVR